MQVQHFNQPLRVRVVVRRLDAEEDCGTTTETQREGKYDPASDLEAGDAVHHPYLHDHKTANACVQLF